MATKIFGIDLSKHNTVTSWQAIKNSGKSFVFLRLGWINSDGTITKDVKFDEFYKGALEVGLDIGVYVFSYLKDSKYSKISAQNTLKLIKDLTITMPIAFDYENDEVSKTLTRKQNTEICKLFLDEIQANKYFAMFYTYTSFIQSYIDMTVLKNYALWIADYREPTGTNCPYKGTWGIWQYAGDKNGTCQGVLNACDLNIAVVDYAKVIKQMGLNGLKNNSNNNQNEEKTEIVNKDNPYNVPLNIKLYTDMKKNVVNKFSYKAHGNIKLSEHFSVKEFASISGKKIYTDEILIHNKLIEILEGLYAKLNCSKIIINSGYRTPQHEIDIGGNKTGVSRHTQGMAADIVCYGKDNKPISAKIVCCALEDMGVLGIGYISAKDVSIHIDSRTKKWFGLEHLNRSINSFHEYFNI